MSKTIISVVEETAEDLRKLSQCIINIKRIIEAHCEEPIGEDKDLSHTFYEPEVLKLSELLRTSIGASAISDQDTLLASLTDDMLLNKGRTERAKKQTDYADDCLSFALGKVQKKRGYSSKPTTGLEEGPLMDYLRDFLAEKQKVKMAEIKKPVLKDFEITLDYDTCVLKIGDDEIRFIQGSDECELLRVMSKLDWHEGVEWDSFEELRPGKEPAVVKRFVGDARDRVNKKVREKIHTSENFIERKKNRYTLVKKNDPAP